MRRGPVIILLEPLLVSPWVLAPPKKAVNRGQSKGNSLAWRHMLAWGWDLLTLPRWVRTAKLERKGPHGQMWGQKWEESRRGSAKIREITRQKHLQEEQFESVMGRDVLEDVLTSLRRNPMLILRTLLSDHVFNYTGRYIWCCGGELVINWYF